MVALRPSIASRAKRNDPDGSFLVSDANLSDYVGQPIFTSDRLWDNDPPAGVVMGLAWTSMGGATLYIETSAISRTRGGVDVTAGGDGDGDAAEAEAEKKPAGTRGPVKLTVTGQLGSVMLESTTIATSFARRMLAELEPENNFFDDHEIHMHVPEGATPKDGPSAGVTMITSLLSLATGKPVRHDLAMTGEVSLTGKVLPIGGVREKTIAARRSGAMTLLFPENNRRDFDELPEYLKEGIDAHFASEYRHIYDVVFGEGGK